MSVFNKKTQVIRDLEVNNDTLRFVLPVLNSQGLIDDDLVVEGLRGVFLKDSNKPELGVNLFLKYKPSKSEEYVKADDKITALGGYVADYDEDDCIVYVIEIKEAFESVLKSFESGEFSQFSDEHKERIANFWQLDDTKTDPLSGVIFQTEVGKEQYKTLPEELQKLSAENELWPVPDMVTESM